MIVWWALANAAILVGPGEGAVSSPTLGQPVELTVTDDAAHPLPGQTVRVVHRPGLGEEQEQAIGITDARGKVEWTPAAPGLARLRAGQQEQVVDVAGPAPVGTWLTGALVLFLAFGSLGWGLRAGARFRERS